MDLYKILYYLDSVFKKAYGCSKEHAEASTDGSAPLRNQREEPLNAERYSQILTSTGVGCLNKSSK